MNVVLFDYLPFDALSGTVVLFMSQQINLFFEFLFYFNIILIIYFISQIYYYFINDPINPSNPTRSSSVRFGSGPNVKNTKSNPNQPKALLIGSDSIQVKIHPTQPTCSPNFKWEVPVWCYNDWSSH